MTNDNDLDIDTTGEVAAVAADGHDGSIDVVDEDATVEADELDDVDVSGDLGVDDPFDDDDDPATFLDDPQAVAAFVQTAPMQPSLAAPDVTQLRTWAAAHGSTNDPYVAGLTNAVDQRQDLTMWAALDPMVLLPHPATKRGSTLTRVSRLLLFLRNVAVFVPVAVTWYSIKQATEAFGIYADAADLADDGRTVNFLRFWQSGGNGELDHMWRIQSVALVDAMLIAAIVIFTLLSGALEARANRISEKQEREIEAERVSVALSVKRALHGSRQSTPESISQSLAESLSDLLGGARLMNNAALRMETLSVGLETMGPRFEQLNQRLDMLSRQMGGDLLTTVDSLRSSVVQLGATVDGDLSQVLNKVLVGLDEIREQLGRTSASVEFGTKNLRDDLDAIHGQLTGVVRGARR